MVNCAHPSHFKNILHSDSNWKNRIKGIRANASIKSHAELDESETLDVGNKEELAMGYQNLKRLLPNLNILGGVVVPTILIWEKYVSFGLKNNRV